jgi:multidrug efflux pump
MPSWCWRTSFRHIEEGLDPFSAAIKGAKEVGFASGGHDADAGGGVCAAGLHAGAHRALFVEFALALAGAVVVSGFMALTLSPMMCSLLLKHNPKPRLVRPHPWNAGSPAMTARYESACAGWSPPAMTGTARWGRGPALKRLLFAMRAGWWLLVMLVCAGHLWILPTMKRELSPLEDRGRILASTSRARWRHAGLHQRYVSAMERIGQPYKEFDRIFVTSGNPTVSQASVFYRTVDWDKAQAHHAGAWPAKCSPSWPLARRHAFPITPPSLGQGFRERPVNFVIVTSESYQNLRVLRQFMDEIAKNPGIVSAPDIDLRLNKPELKVDVDREKAADLGVSVDVVARAIETMLGGAGDTLQARRRAV